MNVTYYTYESGSTLAVFHTTRENGEPMCWMMEPDAPVEMGFFYGMPKSVKSSHELPAHKCHAIHNLLSAYFDMATGEELWMTNGN